MTIKVGASVSAGRNSHTGSGALVGGDVTGARVGETDGTCTGTREGAAVGCEFGGDSSSLSVVPVSPELVWLLTRNSANESGM